MTSTYDGGWWQNKMAGKISWPFFKYSWTKQLTKCFVMAGTHSTNWNKLTVSCFVQLFKKGHQIWGWKAAPFYSATVIWTELTQNKTLNEISFCPKSIEQSVSSLQVSVSSAFVILYIPNRRTYFPISQLLILIATIQNDKDLWCQKFQDQEPKRRLV